MTIRQPALFALTWLALAIALAGVSYGTARTSILANVTSQMEGSLPADLDRALVNADDTNKLEANVRQALDHYLTDLPMVSAVTGNTLGRCQAGHISTTLGNEAPTTSSDLHIEVPAHNAFLSIDLNVECSPASNALLLQSLPPSLAFALVLSLLPAPMSRERRIWFRALRSQGVPAKQAEQWTARLDKAWHPTQDRLLQTLIDGGVPFPDACRLASDPRAKALTDHQRGWLTLAYPGEEEIDPWAVALSEDRIAFDLDAGKVSIRGLSLPLTRTPLLYFAWYAEERIAGDGWVTNPPSNKPDKRSGEALARFMEQHRGHSRAITELLEKGLRAKTLDQNRNRIKDELIGLLGEKLAAPYLFDTERCGHVARFQYRLRLPPEQIVITASQPV